MFDGLDVVEDEHSVNGITKYENGLGIEDKLRSKNGTTALYFLTDHLGSTVALTDANGKVVSSTSYSWRLIICHSLCILQIRQQHESALVFA